MSTHTLSTHDITMDYGSGPVLGGVSLTVPAGEQLAIMGPSGSGKSTLLHCLSGVLVPTSGTVEFGAYQISTLSDQRRSELRLRQFGFVFQDGQLLPELTAAENVALPARLNGVSRSAALKEAQHVLDQVGIGEFATRRPGQLSGGQAQRVAVARALMGNPSVIFADEPTGALDQATGHEIIQLLTMVARSRGASLVLVTHDPKVADWCQRRIEIRDGIIHDDVVVR